MEKTTIFPRNFVNHAFRLVIDEGTLFPACQSLKPRFSMDIGKLVKNRNLFDEQTNCNGDTTVCTHPNLGFFRYTLIYVKTRTELGWYIPLQNTLRVRGTGRYLVTCYRPLGIANTVAQGHRKVPRYMLGSKSLTYPQIWWIWVSGVDSRWMRRKASIRLSKDHKKWVIRSYFTWFLYYRAVSP